MEPETIPEDDARPSRWVYLVGPAVLALAVGSLLWLLLSPAAVVAAFIAYLSLGPEPFVRRRAQAFTVVGAALVAAVAFVQFLRVEAIAGIVEGGTRATEGRAVSRLREVLFAEDSMRRLHELDHDDDRIGSAALLPELTSELGLRGERRLSPPLLEGFGKSQPTAIGPAHHLAGFLFAVCLPITGGGFSAQPGAEVDEEAAERRFLAYAWPQSERTRLRQAFFLDEHERILQAPAAPGRRLGPSTPPPCDDAVAPATRGDWRPWQDKQPRQSLPGDKPGR